MGNEKRGFGSVQPSRPADHLVFLRTLDALPLAAAFFALEGRLLHESRGMRRLLGSPPSGSALRLEVREFGRRLARSFVARAVSAATAVLELDQHAFGHGQNRYCLRGAYLGFEMLGTPASLLVTLERITREPLSDGALRERFGLTPQEIRVSRRLAAGLSNAAIAKDLRISIHTVRTHGERVREKLGVRSRAAVASRMLAGEE